MVSLRVLALVVRRPAGLAFPGKIWLAAARTTMATRRKLIKRLPRVRVSARAIALFREGEALDHDPFHCRDRRPGCALCARVHALDHELWRELRLPVTDLSPLFADDEDPLRRRLLRARNRQRRHERAFDRRRSRARSVPPRDHERP